MPITRAKATRLLNQREMALYDDSRVNGLRNLDARGLASRVTRARTARDRARELARKHKLASRGRTGSKHGASGRANQRSEDKAGLMADILKRFEARLREVEREDRAASKRKPAKAAKKATRAAPRKKAAAKPATRAATGKQAVAKKPASARKATGAKAASKVAKKTPSKAPAKRASGRGNGTRRPRKLTPEQALEQTRTLLEAKHERDHEPKPWQDLPHGATAAGQPGFQSDGAARRARRLHAAEARIPAIQGSISTRDRINQGKRDHRGDTD